MALDTIAEDGIIVKTRDEMRALYLRSLKIRNPLASIAQDTQPWIDASVVADVLSPMSLNARTIGRSIPLSEVSGDRLDQRLAEYGLPPRFPETGSQGAVTIDASATGATIPVDTELTDADNGLRFKCSATNLYHDRDSVPVSAIDTDTQTNLEPGTVLVWGQSIAGLFSTCTVTEQTDGSGFSGGRGIESDDEVRARISDELADPAAAGNDSEYQKLVENSLGHGVAVQKCFTYASINGPGTMGVAFTMKPATVGGSRRPNSTQISTVMAYVTGQLPGDDSYLPITLLQQLVDVSFDVNWASGTDGWADAAPWPIRYAVGSGAIVVSSATSAVAFTLSADNGIYAGVTPPATGMNVAFLDKSAAGGVFRQKRILAVTGTGPWAVTIDTSNGSSDTIYTPAVGQRACPWSNSLQTIVQPVLDYYGTLGPGEQLSTFFDPGVRQKRNPVPPKKWPSSISNRITTELFELQPVNDVDVIDGLGTTSTIGTPGATAYLIELGFISAFPL